MRGIALSQIVKNNTSNKTIHAKNKINSRCYSLFKNKIWNPSEDITYRKNINIICDSHVFFYTILNVDRYSHFLPYVTKSKITEKLEEQFKAVLHIQNIFFKEKYDSLIRFKYPTNITVSSADTNLFNHLITEWIIEQKPDCINVHFYINFRLKNRIYQNFMNMYIRKLGNMILYAFIKEARANSFKNVDLLFPHLLDK
ncbi:hypothetical protein, conserved [Plasmodium gonderi]|uniref:Coenzyme Q-binding protein COQ10 START domain-containing protein n=1 Tax=Plasmodium gonderi TaxID=77519 RepID=A0A1Y1JDY6_PLAGO|nr:hypothetical protein, conserved [Plasmodium gonderi]GAW78962.1 hypothetical protein, conserved [Plasmodium gonderi]